MRFARSVVVTILLTVVCYGSQVVAQDTVTIFFDNIGDEFGVTPRLTADFSFMGSSWTGGIVEREGIPALYASGAFSYEVLGGGGRVTFDSPVDSVNFFYVHGSGFAEGQAVAYNASNTPIAMGDRVLASGAGEKFLTFDPSDSIVRVEFTAGVVDSFSFTTEAPPPGVLAGDVRIALEEVASGLTAPVMLTHAGDGSGRLFVVDQVGLIRVIENDVLLEEPFLDVSSVMVDVNEGFDERGLLGLAFHPEYPQNGRFFIRYSKPRAGDPSEPCNDPESFIPGCHSAVLAEYSVDGTDPNRADPLSEIILLEVDEPQFNHNGGHVAFGPDGLLYLSLGDGGGAHDGLAEDPPLHGSVGHGQNIETLLGSILRIDVDSTTMPFGIPDNPFVGVTGRDEIYAYGFRNPYRFSFDRGGANELFVADVGQNLFEEIDVVSRGDNYGWVTREGAHCFDPLSPDVPPLTCDTTNLVDPVAEYDHSEGLAVIGGYVYRGAQSANLTGKYVFGDFSIDFGASGRLFYLDTEGDRSEIFEFDLVSGSLGRVLFGFGEDEEGELYVLTSLNIGPSGTTGEVLRLIAGGQQTPGDCNQDGTVDISDALCVILVLFGGDGPLEFPCGDGTSETVGNELLLDGQPDGLIARSDVIFSLTFLFGGDTPAAHHLAVPGMEITACVDLPGCGSSAECQ